MSQTTISPLEVDEVKIIIIMDNITDLLMEGTEVAHRFPLGPNPHEHPLLIAEHGFSAIIQVKLGDKYGSVLFDTGVSPMGVLYNMDVMELDVKEIQAIVLSHGHPDHAMGLPNIIDRMDKTDLRLVFHPDALLERKVILPNGSERRLPAPKVADIRRASLEIVETIGPTTLIDDMILISGEITRTSDFEKGFPIHYAKRNDVWKPDPLIMDDQCIITNVRGKGLVVLTGCGHAGIINTIHHAQALTGVQRIYAVIGGFHLTGGLYEAIIPVTISELIKINPRYVMPGHCTGWSATHQIARLMPEAFIPNNVGTILVL